MTRSRVPIRARRERPALQPATPISQSPQDDGLSRHGIQHPGQVFSNLEAPALYEEALRRREGELAHGGALVVRTGEHTGRSPNDKFIVEDPSSAERIWWGNVNRPFDAHKIEALHSRGPAPPPGHAPRLAHR